MDQLNKQRPSRLAPPQETFECRITHVRYVALGVDDLDATSGFYRDEWGLADAHSESGLAFLSAEGSSDPFALRLRQAEENRLDLVSFAVRTRGDVDWYADKLVSAGVTLISEPGALDSLGGGYGLRFFDPVEGRTLEISSEVRPRKAREVQSREHIPVGISHMVMNSAKLPELVNFFHRVLGFYKSDYLEDQMVFLKGDTPAHHQFAVAANKWANVNHIAYETRGIDEYLRAAGALVRRGHQMVWGPGRHGPGDNTFAYFSDPSGFVAEYTTALEPIVDVAQWQPRIWHRVPSESDQWGVSCIRNPEPFIGKADNGRWVAPPI
ncbi:VOC family protein [Nocardia sp. R6R-6]|uniref:VOC family protein n=1 Tax=Nocardia sp. R6R-6 TaxID=3459303 RepID=UPI00403D8FE2